MMLPPQWKPGSSSGCEKRVRVQFDDAIDLSTAESARRTLMSLPPSLVLVSDLIKSLRARLCVVPLPNLSVSIDGFTLPNDQQLHHLVRDNDVLRVREGSDVVHDAGSSPSPKRRRQMTMLGAREETADGMLAGEFSPGTLAALDAALVGARETRESQRPREPLVSSAAAARASKAVLDSCGEIMDQEVDDLKAAKAAALARAEQALLVAQEPSKEEGVGGERKDTKQESTDEHRVFVGGLPWSIDEDILRRDFSECGEITDLHLLRDKETGGSRGMAFISFANAAGFQAAIKYDGDDYGGRTLKVCRAESKKGGKSTGKGKGKQSKKGRGGY